MAINRSIPVYYDDICAIYIKIIKKTFKKMNEYVGISKPKKHSKRFGMEV